MRRREVVFVYPGTRRSSDYNIIAGVPALPRRVARLVSLQTCRRNLKLIDSLITLKVDGIKDSCHTFYRQLPEIIRKRELSTYYVCLDRGRAKIETEDTNTLKHFHIEKGSNRAMQQHNK